MLGSCGQLQAQSFDLTKLWTPILHGCCQWIQRKAKRNWNISGTQSSKELISSRHKTSMVLECKTLPNNERQRKSKVKCSDNISKYCAGCCFFFSSALLPQYEQLTRPLQFTGLCLWSIALLSHSVTSAATSAGTKRFSQYIATARNKALIQKRQSTSCWKSYRK